ncbi:MAG: hypothetical protein M3O71_16280 [Bacteroidota bacterium]|nr:hypothetical protein [Bacteroidota bacterium]
MRTAIAGIACAGNARTPSGTRARTKPPFTNPVFSNGLGGLDLAFSNRKFLNHETHSC